MGFSKQEYWSGLPFPSPGDLPDPGIEPSSPALQADALPAEPPANLILKSIAAYDSADGCGRLNNDLPKVFKGLPRWRLVVKNLPAM